MVPDPGFGVLFGDIVTLADDSGLRRDAERYGEGDPRGYLEKALDP